MSKIKIGAHNGAELDCGVTYPTSLGDIFKLNRLNPTQLDAYVEAGADDRMWFATHPGRRYRFRPIIKSERLVLIAPHATHTLVEQIAPGIRLRLAYIWTPRWLPDDDTTLGALARGSVSTGGEGTA
jgi:hypothetical protein